MSKKYKQKPRQAWMQDPAFKNWLAVDAEDDAKCYCKYCKSSINAKISDLHAYAKTAKHKSTSACFTQKNKIPFVSTTSLKTCQQEAALCLYIAAHSSVYPIDHLGLLCGTKFQDGSAMKLHRLKCTSIIKNVFAPNFIELLREDIGDAKYSLLLDESTDISVCKTLGVAINYFSSTRSVMVSTFLSLVPLTEGDSKSIVNSLCQELSNFKLNHDNLIAIGTDNASVMVGSKQSVYTELKKKVPSLILIKCVCHSLQLAVNSACKNFLPEALEYIVYQTYNWFSKSAKRQSDYKQIYQLINSEENPLKIPRVCDTRWLSIEAAVTRILKQWIELKLHFSIAATNEKSFTARTLHTLFSDDVNHLYLLFLHPVLAQMQHINKIFQTSTGDSTKLLDDLVYTINLLKLKIIPPNVSIDILKNDFEHFVKHDCYLGYAFETKLKEYKEKNVSIDIEAEIRANCCNFIVSLINELKQRLPDNFEILQQVDLFSVDKILCAKKADIVDILNHFKVESSRIEEIISQYSSVHLIKWSNLKDTASFSAEVSKFVDAAGNKRFSALASFALSLLSLPWSNAEVERVFSQMNNVKTKLRNRMAIQTLNSILHIRYGLRREGKCYHDYEVPEVCLKKIGTNQTYISSDAEDDFMFDELAKFSKIDLIQ